MSCLYKSISGKECDQKPDGEKKFCRKHLRTKQARKYEEDTKVLRKQPMRKKIVRRNDWGRYEDRKTHILFDRYSKRAYGVQLSSGNVRPLRPNEIELCDARGWKWIVPNSDDEKQPTSCSIDGECKLD